MSDLPTGWGGEKGQAIVLIAIALAVVVGMAALAIDGSRAYSLRRDLQVAVDAAALAAADSLQQTGNYITAETAASTIFGTNLHLYSSPSCSPVYGSPGASGSRTMTCNFPDGTVGGTVLTQVVSDLGPQGSQFAMTAKRSLALQFARILTNGGTPRLTATSAGNVNNLLFSPTLAALNQAGCGGTSGTAISIDAGGTLNVVGDLVSGGVVSAANATQVAGDVYARCQSSISNVTTMCYPSGTPTPCTYPNVAGAVRPGYRFVDPNYPAPAVAGGSQPSPGSSNNVELSPGTYAANPSIASGKCYFLSAGVYRWQSGYTSNGGFVSNELKPPDEANVLDNAATAPDQFWNTNGPHCAGAFTWTPSGSGGADVGTWGVELTSVRNDSYAGTSYQRESAPSRCRSIANVKSNQWVNLTITNPPGAQSYNIYTSSTGCTGFFGFVYNLPANGLPGQNNDTSGCSTPGVGTCTLGTTTLTAPAILLPFVPAPSSSATPGTPGAYPPDRETSPLQSGLPNQNANRANPWAGDRANENVCLTSGAGALTACPGPITPGAVAFTFPSGLCLNNTNGGDTYVFSGYQYNWIAVHQPTGSGCSNTLGAAGNSAYVGLVYTPSAILNVPNASGFGSRATGGMIADTINFNGTLPSIVGSLNYMPTPPAARLVG